MATYAEKLKDPRWQKRRLEVLDDRGWVCENCGSATETLHVHHGHYESGLDPWDYSPIYLHVLCEGCHQRAHDLLIELHRSIGTLSLMELAKASILFAHAASRGLAV